jgi:hypothetical protein
MLWLLPAVVVLLLTGRVAAQVASPALRQFQVQTLCSLLTYKYVYTPQQQQQTLAQLTPAQQQVLMQYLAVLDFLLAIDALPPRQQLQALLRIPPDFRLATIQFLHAMPDALRCANAGGGTPVGGTGPLVQDPACNLTTPVSTSCPCNDPRITGKDTRDQTGQVPPPPGASLCCCLLPPDNPDACCNQAQCPTTFPACGSASVEWAFLAGVGLLLGGRWLSRRRRTTAQHG